MNRKFIVISRTNISGFKLNVIFNKYKLIKKEIQSMQKSKHEQETV